jgi:hypothetical protein
LKSASTWTTEQISFIKENFDTMRTDELSEELNIPLPDIMRKANDLGLIEFLYEEC